MTADLEKRLARLSTQPDLLSYSEAALKQAVVLPVLADLGWDTEDVSQVMPELSVEGGRVDFALRLNGIEEVFVEVKRGTEQLQHHEEQLLEYAFRRGVELAVLTNGLTWWFYLPKQKGSWRDRRFLTIDLREQDQEEATDKFASLLGRAAVQSGEAPRTAVGLLRGQARRAAVLQSLPKAWHRIVTEPDELLVELLAETVERLSGHRPEVDEVAAFLARETAASRLAAGSSESVSTGVAEGGRRTGSAAGRRFEPTAPAERLTQNDLVPVLVRVLQKRGGQARKNTVEQDIYEEFRSLFEDPWYQESVSHGVPRWKHNIAWAKEIAKKDGLVHPPAKSGRGIWKLTERGLAQRGER